MSQDSENEISNEQKPDLSVTPDEKAILTKDEAISTEVDEKAWLRIQPNVEHLVRLLEIQTKNYQLAQEKYAMWGTALVPPIVVHTLEEAENEVLRISKELQETLSYAYGRQVIAIDENVR